MKLFLVFLFVASCQARTFSKVSKCPPGYYGSYCRERCSACPEDSCDPVSGQCLLLCPPGKIGDRCDTDYEEVDELVKVTEKMFNALKKEDLKEDTHERREPNLKIALFTTPNGRYVIKIGSKMNLKMTHNTEMTHNLEKAAADRVDGLDSVHEYFQKVLDNLMPDVKEMEKQGGLEVVLGDIFENNLGKVASKVEDDAFERRDNWGDLDFIGHLRKPDKTRAEKLRPHFNEFKKPAQDVEDDAVERRDIWGDLDFIGRLRKPDKNRAKILQPVINTKRPAHDVEDDAFERRDWGENRPEKSQPVININKLAQDLLNNKNTKSKNGAQQAIDLFIPLQLGDLWHKIVKEIDAHFNTDQPQSD